MLKSEVLKYSKEYSKWFSEAYDVLKDRFYDDYVSEICKLRGYVGKEQKEKIAKLELGRCEVPVVEDLGVHRKELGLVSKNDSFILSDRYIIPIYDIAHNLVALVGWYPDSKKYITTPSMFFAKEVLFYNIDEAFELSWSKYNGLVFLVEGMFDCISLSAIGLPAIATMGSTVTRVKKEQLKLFKKVIGISDNDKVGRRALNRYDKKYGWQLPSNGTMLRIKGGNLNINGVEFHVKDMDDFVSLYDADSVRETLLQFEDCNDEIADLII